MTGGYRKKLEVHLKVTKLFHPVKTMKMKHSTMNCTDNINIFQKKKLKHGQSYNFFENGALNVQIQQTEFLGIHHY